METNAGAQGNDGVAVKQATWATKVLPWADVEKDPGYVKGDVDRKREYLKAWYEVNSKIMAEDGLGRDEIAREILPIADYVRQKEKIDTTFIEGVGDVVANVLPAVGAGMLAAPTGPGAIPAAIAGGVAGEAWAQQRRIARGEQFGYNPVSMVALGALNVVPMAKVGLATGKNIAKAAFVDAARLGGASVGASMAGQQYERGEIDIGKAAEEGLMNAAGAGVLRGGLELGMRALPSGQAALKRGLRQRDRGEAAPAEQLALIAEKMGVDELTEAEQKRLTEWYGKREAAVVQAEADKAALAKQMADEQAAMDAAQASAEGEGMGAVGAVTPRARRLTEEELMAGANVTEDVTGVGTPIDEFIGKRDAARKERLKVFLPGEEEVAGPSSIEIDTSGMTTPVDDFISGVQNANAVKSTEAVNAGILAEISRFKELGIPVNEETKAAAKAIALAGDDNVTRGQIRSFLNKKYLGAGVPAVGPAIPKAAPIKSLADLNIEIAPPVAPAAPVEKVTMPSIVSSADNAMVAGSLGDVNNAANKVAGVKQVGAQAPLGEQIAPVVPDAPVKPSYSYELTEDGTYQVLKHEADDLSPMVVGDALDETAAKALAEQYSRGDLPEVDPALRPPEEDMPAFDAEILPDDIKASTAIPEGVATGNPDVVIETDKRPGIKSDTAKVVEVGGERLTTIADARKLESNIRQRTKEYAQIRDKAVSVKRHESKAASAARYDSLARAKAEQLSEIAEDVLRKRAALGDDVAAEKLARFDEERDLFAAQGDTVDQNAVILKRLENTKWDGPIPEELTNSGVPAEWAKDPKRLSPNGLRWLEMQKKADAETRKLQKLADKGKFPPREILVDDKGMVKPTALGLERFPAADEYVHGLADTLDVGGVYRPEAGDANVAYDMIEKAFREGKKGPPLLTLDDADLDKKFIADKIRKVAADIGSDEFVSTGKKKKPEVGKLGFVAGNQVLPSTGEAMIGAAAGYGFTRREEGESEEAYKERRINNALLGMSIGGLGGAALNRLARNMGGGLTGDDLRKFGAKQGQLNINVPVTPKAKPVPKLSAADQAEQARLSLVRALKKANGEVSSVVAGTQWEKYADVSAPVLAAIKAGPEAGFDLAKAVKEAEAASKAAREATKAGPRSKLMEAVEYFDQKFVMGNRHVVAAARKLKEAGIKIDAFDDPEMLWTTWGANSGVRAQAWLDRHNVGEFYKFELPALAKKLGTSVDTTMATLDRYLLAKQALTHFSLGRTVEEVGSNFTQKEAANIVAAGADTLEDAARFINNKYKALLDESVEAGLVSKELADELTATYGDYVPFTRIFSVEELEEMGSGMRKGGRANASLSAQTRVRAFEGSQRQVESPLDNLFNHVYDTHREIGKNKVALSMFSMVTGSTKAKEIGEALGFKPLFRTTTDASGDINPLVAKGAVERIAQKDGPPLYRLLDEQGNARLDSDGKQVFLPRSSVEEIADGKYIGDGKVVPTEDAAKAKHKMSAIWNGTRIDMAVTKNIEDAVKGLNVPAAGLFFNLMNVPLRVARAGFTAMSLPFAFRQIPRDAMQVAANLKGFKHLTPMMGVRYVQGMNEAFKNRLEHVVGSQNQFRRGQVSQAFNEYGGRLAFADMLRTTNEARPNARRMAGQIKWSERPMHMLREIEDFLSGFEDMTRMTVFRHEVDRLVEEAAKKGLNVRKGDATKGEKNFLVGNGREVDNIYQEAAFQAQEITANYLQRGEWGRALNGVFLYLNAGIQGTRANLKAFNQDKVGYATKVFALGGTGLAAVTAWNMMDEDRRNAYTDLTEQDRNNNLILIPPGPIHYDQDGNLIAVRIPLPYGISAMPRVVRRGVENIFGFAASQEDYPEVMKIAADMVAFTTPFEASATGMASTLTPQAVRPVVETYVNKQLFSNQEVVPKRLKDLPPEDQYTATTPLVAREIGSLLGVSPMVIAHLTKGYTGTIGDTAMWAADSLIVGPATGRKARGMDPIEQTIRSFTKSRGGEQMNRFYENFDAADEAMRGVKAAQANGDTKRLNEILENDMWYLQNHKMLSDASNQMREIYSQIRTLEARIDDMPEAKEYITELRKMLTDIARTMNEAVDARQAEK